MKNMLRVMVIIFCLVGAGLSAVSLRNHYSTAPTGYCALDETFDCDLVNHSVYSRFLGMPVALIGLMGYLALFAMTLWRDRFIARLRAAAAWIGLGFALYLTYIEAHVLAVWCLLCIGSLIAISGIAVVSTVALFQRPGEKIGGKGAFQ
jgi:uncharacterized membrane protein